MQRSLKGITLRLIKEMFVNIDIKVNQKAKIVTYFKSESGEKKPTFLSFFLIFCEWSPLQLIMSTSSCFAVWQDIIWKTHNKQSEEVRRNPKREIKELPRTLRETINRRKSLRFISVESPLNLCSIFLRFLCCCLIHILSRARSITGWLSCADFNMDPGFWLTLYFAKVDYRV